MKGVIKQECPVMLSITETVSVEPAGTVIQRNNTREYESREVTDIYLRAREIYFRARRHRPVRAVSIF
jgi:hypothetical protein